MNDDQLDAFIYQLHEYIIHHPLLVDPEYEDEGYDHLHEFVWQRLGQFSNGERNWN